MVQEQEQFLDVVDRDTAEHLWWQAIRPVPLGTKQFAWLSRWGVCWLRTSRPRLMCRRSTGPTWTVMRSADDTYGASEESPRRLRLGGEEIPTGAVPRWLSSRARPVPLPRVGCCRAAPMPC